LPGWVQDLGNVGSSATGTTLAITLGVTVPVGDYVICGGSANAAVSSVADSKGNTYTKDASQTAASPQLGIFSAPVTTQLVSTDTITLTTVSSGGRIFCASQYTGLRASPADQTNTGATGTAVSTVTTTNGSATVQAVELVVAFLTTSAATTAWAASGYTLRPTGVSTGTVHDGMLADKIVGAVETSSAVFTWTTATNCAAVLVTYKLLNPPTPRIGRGIGLDQAVNRGATY
jgi:hypothetical protein